MRERKKDILTSSKAKFWPMRQLVYNKIGCLPNHQNANKNKNRTYAKRVLVFVQTCYGTTYSIKEPSHWKKMLPNGYN